MKKITLVDKTSEREYVLPKGNGIDLQVGRSRRNDVVIPDCPITNSVSREHCIIHKYEDGTAFVSDNNTNYGTYLNGRKLGVGRKRQDGKQLKDIWMIRNGDELRLGDYALEIKVEEEMPLTPGE